MVVLFLSALALSLVRSASSAFGMNRAEAGDAQPMCYWMALGCQHPFISPANTHTHTRTHKFPLSLSLFLFPIFLCRRLLFAPHKCHRRVYIISVAADARFLFAPSPFVPQINNVSIQFPFRQVFASLCIRNYFYTIIIVYRNRSAKNYFGWRACTNMTAAWRNKNDNRQNGTETGDRKKKGTKQHGPTRRLPDPVI